MRYLRFLGDAAAVVVILAVALVLLGGYWAWTALRRRRRRPPARGPEYWHSMARPCVFHGEGGRVRN